MIKSGQERALLWGLAVQQSLFLAAGLGLWAWSGRELGEFVRFSWLDVLFGLGLTGAMIGLHFLLFGLWRGGLEQMARVMGRTVFSTERPYRVSAILILSLSAGIGEEALFRGGIQTMAGTYLPAWAAIAVTSILFALVHPGSRTFMVCVGGVSLILGLAYFWSGSLLAVMMAHAGYDVFACFRTQRELRRMGHWQAVREPGAEAAAEPV